ncbi:MAG: bifunctional phosphoribosylaminoimidazolecarboxamide formyltransferase/IMP cyclohydrolase [Pseudomonadota bacterium]
MQSAAMSEDILPIARALLSVSDKTGLTDFATGLAGSGVELVSTGGTKKAIADAGIEVRDVSNITASPEMMDGRVKTLHPKIHGGILADRSKQSHLDAMKEHGIGGIDLVAVNLYPFEATVRGGADFKTAIENIDIGGPAMIRAAAKNHAHVVILTDPADYTTVLSEMSELGGVSSATRRRLAAKAFARTAVYDATIGQWFAAVQNDEVAAQFPGFFAAGGRQVAILRYGENPHQQAAYYADGRTDAPSVVTATQVQGKELSFNNINDTDAAFALVAEFGSDTPAVAIIKHANPCGVATGASLTDAYGKALACDPVSAFGGILAFNQALDIRTAEAITGIFTEVIIAPGASDEAKAVIAGKPNLRLLLTDGLPDPSVPGLDVRTISGGLLVQSRDNGLITPSNLTVATARAPTDTEMEDLLFAWKVAKHVKSNAIVYAREGATVGIGAGQMSRLDSARIAARKAEDAAEHAGRTEPATVGSVVASDAFFPFADGLLSAVEAGATAVIQPGGSMRDNEVIAAADEKGIAMVFTGMRHFRH